jgi:glutathione synthase/RimK-type ligase-like ATP-grasp enzyme
MHHTDCDVVIVAPMHDLHARAVIDELKRADATVALVSLRHLTKGDSLSIHGDVDQTAVLRVGDSRVDLNHVTSIWWRRPENPVRADGTAEAWFKHQEWESVIFSLESVTRCKWVNVPSRQWVAKRKAFQMTLARELGIRTPLSLISNDPVEARAFAERFPKIIYKSMGETAHPNTATRFLSDTDMQRLGDLPNCPAIFQEFIDAKHDIRVTVVGDRVFAVRIDSQSGGSTLDWRFDHSVDFELFALDAGEESLLVRLTRLLGLTYAALDLRETPEGELVFLEANPAGQYLFAELITGAKISEAMSELLTHES